MDEGLDRDKGIGFTQPGDVNAGQLGSTEGKSGQQFYGTGAGTAGEQLPAGGETFIGAERDVGHGTIAADSPGYSGAVLPDGQRQEAGGQWGGGLDKGG